MHALRHYRRRQSVGLSHEQAIQAPYDSSQAPSSTPEGKYVPGAYVSDRPQSTMEAEAFSMTRASKGVVGLSNMSD